MLSFWRTVDIKLNKHSNESESGSSISSANENLTPELIVMSSVQMTLKLF